MTREIEARIPMKFSILSERRAYSPYGLEGGEPGSVGVNYVFKKNAEAQLEKINIGAKAVVRLNAGDYIQINSPGERPLVFRL
jgi:5-oxoprolinase (ATP-hydrolysing)